MLGLFKKKFIPNENDSIRSIFSVYKNQNFLTRNSELLDIIYRKIEQEDSVEVLLNEYLFEDYREVGEIQQRLYDKICIIIEKNSSIDTLLELLNQIKIEKFTSKIELIIMSKLTSIQNIDELISFNTKLDTSKVKAKAKPVIVSKIKSHINTLSNLNELIEIKKLCDSMHLKDTDETKLILQRIDAILNYENVVSLFDASNKENIDRENILSLLNTMLSTQRDKLKEIDLRYEANDWFYSRRNAYDKDEILENFTKQLESEKTFYESLPYNVFQKLENEFSFSLPSMEFIEFVYEYDRRAFDKRNYSVELKYEYFKQASKNKNAEFREIRPDHLFLIGNLYNLSYLVNEYNALLMFINRLPQSYHFIFETYLKELKENLSKNFIHILPLPNLTYLYMRLYEKNCVDKRILVDTLKDFFEINSIEYMLWYLFFVDAPQTDMTQEIESYINETILVRLKEEKETEKFTSNTNYSKLFKELNKNINNQNNYLVKALRDEKNYSLVVYLFEHSIKYVSVAHYIRLLNEVLTNIILKALKNNDTRDYLISLFKNKYEVLALVIFDECLPFLSKYEPEYWNTLPEVKEARSKIKNRDYSRYWSYVQKLIVTGKGTIALYLASLQNNLCIEYCDYSIKALASLNQYEVIESYYKEFVCLHQNLDFLHLLGRHYLDQKNIEQLKEILSEIIALEPEYPFIKEAKSVIERVTLIGQLASSNITIESINDCSGQEFEMLLIEKFKLLGFKAKETPITGDYGADIILEDENQTRYIIQCKRFKSKVNLKAVQEVVGALAHFNGDIGIVITNSGFLNSAIKLAESNDIELWDGTKLMKFLNGDISFSKLQGE